MRVRDASTPSEIKYPVVSHLCENMWQVTPTGGRSLPVELERRHFNTLASV